MVSQVLTRLRSHFCMSCFLPGQCSGTNDERNQWDAAPKNGDLPWFSSIVLGVGKHWLDHIVWGFLTTGSNRIYPKIRKKGKLHDKTLRRFGVSIFWTHPHVVWSRSADLGLLPIASHHLIRMVKTLEVCHVPNWCDRNSLTWGTTRPVNSMLAYLVWSHSLKKRLKPRNMVPHPWGSSSVFPRS